MAKTTFEILSEALVGDVFIITCSDDEQYTIIAKKTSDDKMQDVCYICDGEIPQESDTVFAITEGMVSHYHNPEYVCHIPIDMDMIREKFPEWFV